jgi:hypothetical protein
MLSFFASIEIRKGRTTTLLTALGPAAERRSPSQ